MGTQNPNQTGRYKGTGIAFNIDTPGFTPKYIRFINETTGAEAEWTDQMADGSVRTSDSGTDAFATSNGVTPRNNGFTVGTNAVINTSADVVHWLALGN